MTSRLLVSHDDSPLQFLKRDIFELDLAGGANCDGPGRKVGALGARPQPEIENDIAAAPEDVGGKLPHDCFNFTMAPVVVGMMHVVVVEPGLPFVRRQSQCTGFYRQRLGPGGLA